MKSLLTSPHPAAHPPHSSDTASPGGTGGEYLLKQVSMVMGSKTDPRKAKALVKRLRKMGWHQWPHTGVHRWRSLPRVLEFPGGHPGSGCGLRGVWAQWLDGLELSLPPPPQRCSQQQALIMRTTGQAPPRAGCDHRAAPPTDGHRRGPPRPGLDSFTGAKPLWG